MKLHIAQSSTVPYPGLAHPLAIRSSNLSSCHLPFDGPAINPLPNQVLNHPVLSSDVLFFLDLAFFLAFFSRSFDDPGREREYGSGSSAKLIRLGVPAGDGVAVPIALATPFPNTSARLSVLGDGAGVGGTERIFSEEWTGGEGGRVESE